MFLKGWKGFTLVELLVVVLIIGVLTAIALPMYQGAVDKSHWSTMLAPTRAIKNAEEAIRMTNGSYTNNMDDLDVTIENGDVQYTLLTPNNTADPNLIRATNSKLDGVRLASYLDDSPMFAGQLHCEANNDRGKRLCEKLLQGQELTSSDGYIGYLLDQAIDKDTCDDANRSWSSSKTKCYKTTTERCTDLGMGVVASMDDQCGYTNGTGGKDVGEEGVCLVNSEGTSWSCGGVTYTNGGKCIGDGGYVPCGQATFANGGICEGISGRACIDVTVNAGGVCHGLDANSFGGCESVQINQGGVCIGDAQGACAMNSHTVDGGICVGNKIWSCDANHENTFVNGAVCYANESGACQGPWHWPNDPEMHAALYDSTSCCCGKFCNSAVPKCADRGIACDPKYLK